MVFLATRSTDPDLAPSCSPSPDFTRDQYITFIAVQSRCSMAHGYQYGCRWQTRRQEITHPSAQQEQQISAQILAVVVLRTHTWPSAAARDWNTQRPHMAAQATQISMTLVAEWLLDTQMATSGTTDIWHSCAIYWQQTLAVVLSWDPEMALGSSPRLDIIMALSGKKVSNISLHLITLLLLFFLFPQHMNHSLLSLSYIYSTYWSQLCGARWALECLPATLGHEDTEWSVGGLMQPALSGMRWAQDVFCPVNVLRTQVGMLVVCAHLSQVVSHGHGHIFLPRHNLRNQAGLCLLEQRAVR